ncbi:MAG: kinesin [Sedimenticola sp.]|jgi:tetratricopeptide (TPR) repeat protein|nr:MAG: kinesin [Sedimenticola sp.]
MNSTILKVSITLLLPACLLASNSQAQQTDSHLPIINAIERDGVVIDQSQHLPAKQTLTTPSEVLLEEVKTSNRLQAAQIAYRQSNMERVKHHPESAYRYLQEAVALHPSNLDYLQLASQLAYTLERYDEAEAYQLRAVENARITLTIEDHRMATLLENLAAIYLRQMHLDKSALLLQQALSIRENVLGKMDPMVAVSLNKIASLKIIRGQIPGVEELLTRSLNIMQTASGHEHPNTAWAMHKLADFLRTQQRLEQAETLYQQAVAIWESAPDDRRIDQATSRRALGEVLMAQNRPTEAEKEFKQVVTLLNELLGEEHPFTEAARNQLAKAAEKPPISDAKTTAGRGWKTIVVPPQKEQS